MSSVPANVSANAQLASQQVAMHNMQAEAMRRQQQQMHAAQSAGMMGVNQTAAPSNSASYGQMGLAAAYGDLPLQTNDDIYFLGRLNQQQPFAHTPKPSFFDGYETACRSDSPETVQQIVSDHQLTSAMLHHGLTLALRTGSVKVASQLLEQNAPIVRRTSRNMLSAPTEAQIPLLELLLSRGWKPEHELFMESLSNLPLLRWFLSHGVDPNYGIKRDTPYRAGGPSHECADALEAAAAAGNAEAVAILLDAGAKVEYGTPLHRAAAAQPPGSAFFAKHAAQDEQFDNSRIPVMRVLVEHGADVNQLEDTPHMTPRYPVGYAVVAGAVRRVRWLLERGANPELKGGYGSAVEYAEKMGTEEMREVVAEGVRLGRWRTRNDGSS